MSSKTCWVGRVVFLIAFGFAGIAQAQPGQPVPEKELAGIRVALERIAGLLERQVDASSTELVFRRLALLAEEAGPLQSELNNLRTAMAGHESRLAEAESQHAALRSQIDAGLPPEGETLDALKLRAQSLSDDLAGRRKLLSVLRNRASEVEVELAAKNAERDEWKRFLDQKLARLGR